MAKKKITGAQRFDQYYADIYQDRWPELKSSFLGEKTYVAHFNPYYPNPPQLIGKAFYKWGVQAPQFPRPQANEVGLFPYYLMDGASLLAAQQLPIKPGDTVLDLCAAPGGKTLILAYKLRGQGKLIANDRSRDRYIRLKKVIDSYIPQPDRQIIETTNRDGGRFGMESPQTFDHILLDAPCSSERHVIESPKHLDDWRPSRTKKLSKDQVTLICSAFDALKEGGTLLYSTCSISPLENDKVVERLLQKRDQAEIIPLSLPMGGPTQFGYHILPDRDQHGPIFLCHLKKKSIN